MKKQKKESKHIWMKSTCRRATMKVNGFKVGGRTYKPRKSEVEKSMAYLIMLIKQENKR